MGLWRTFGKALVRKKPMSGGKGDEGESELKRCLSTFDLTFLGIGSTLGLGMYVIAGQVAAKSSGPAVIISFLIAAVVSVFSGFCYAEFGGRVPKAGSAYIYSYVTVGEFTAFIIGWNLILEYVIGTASVARGYSDYIDSLFGSPVKNYFTKIMPIHIPYISGYPDFLALGITLLLTALLSFGVKESTRFNNIFTCINLFVVVYVVICGSFKAKLSNWQLPANQIPAGRGKGGFFPYGLSSMMQGAATCFYSFVGFDCIATSGEEAKNPQKAIPISIVISLLTVFCAYFGISAIQTLMWPYYDQYQQAPLPYVFDMVGWHTAKWVISIGALAGLSTSLLGGMFPLPRVIYAMASDGIIFRGLGKVNSRFGTPVLATMLSGCFAGGMAMMFEVDVLTEMMSIGTLLAYSLVALSVLILRYNDNLSPQSLASNSVNVSSSMMISTQQYTRREIWRQVFNMDKHKLPTQLTSKISTHLITLIVFLSIIEDALLVFLEDYLLEIYVLVPISVLFLVIVALSVALSLQPSNPTNLHFKAPGMPYTSIISVFANTYLMFKLRTQTWIRFSVWMVVGFLIYFGYGIWNSSERQRYAPIPEEDILSDNGSDTDDSRRRIPTINNERSPLVSK